MKEIEINKETMRDYFEGILSKPLFSQIQLYHYINSAQEYVKKTSELLDKYGKHWHNATIHNITDDIFILEGKPSKNTDEYWFKPFVMKGGTYLDSSTCTSTLDEAIILSMMLKYNADQNSLSTILKAMNMYTYSYYYEEKATGKLFVIDMCDERKAWQRVCEKHNATYNTDLSIEEIKQLYVLKELL